MLHPYHQRHHDFEFVDRIEIKLVDRWKESEISGDEWRVSAHVTFFFKGVKVGECCFSNMETAMQLLYAGYVDAREGRGHGEPKDLSLAVKDAEKGKCDQPGCSAPATVRFRLKRLYSREGFSADANEHGGYYIQFCDKHCERGDCGLEDADANYVRMENLATTS